MAGFMHRLCQVARSIITRSTLQLPSAPPLTSKATTPALFSQTQRLASSYDPYPDIKTPSPFKKREKFRYGYKNILYTGGVLPRPEGEYEDKLLKIPSWKPHTKDQWAQKKALFGQNDYIDILGDGSLEPFQLIKAPVWLKAFKGNEIQRLTRQMRYEGQYLKEFYPTKYHNIRKQIWFLYKRYNRRKHTAYYGGRRASNTSRIDRIRDW